MAIVDIVQRTPEWFAWRKEGITASMIPVIMGLSPYQTPYGLWAELVGLKEPADLSNNWHVQRGVEQEPEARSVVEYELGRPFMPVCVEADHNPLFKASLDGFFDNETTKEVLEIKCPCEKIYLDILDKKSKSEYYQMDRAQVQWQLNASDSSSARLFFYLRGKTPINATINRNDAFIAIAEAKALEFWECIQTKTAPALIEGRDKVVYELEEEKTEAENESDDLWQANVESFKSLTLKVKELDAQRNELKTQLKEFENYFATKIPEDVQTFDTDGIRATRVTRSGSVDQAEFLNALSKRCGVPVSDLESLKEECRKSDSSHYRFTLSKNVISKETEPVQVEQPLPVAATTEEPKKTVEGVSREELEKSMKKAFSSATEVEPVVEETVLVEKITVPVEQTETEVEIEQAEEKVFLEPKPASSFFSDAARSVFF